MTFLNCSNLSNISLGKSITGIAGDAFSGTAFVKDEKNYDEDGFLYLENTLLKIRGFSQEYLTVKYGTTIIAEYAMVTDDAINFKSITIPDTVRYINSYAIGYYYIPGKVNTTRIPDFKVYYHKNTVTKEYWPDAIQVDCNWTETITKKATCTDVGEKSSFCNLCGETVTNYYGPLGHTWGAWVTIKNPTFEETGLEERTCTECEAYEQNILPKPEPIVDPKTQIRVELNTMVEGDPSIYLAVKEEDTNSIHIPGSYHYQTMEAWDIKPIDGNGNIVQPERPVKVWIPLPVGFNRNSIAIYHKHTQDPNDVELVREISFEMHDGMEYVVFYTDSFSTFIIVDTSSQTERPDPNVCHWCGKVHEGFFQKIIGWFHSILAKIFGSKY